MAGAGQKRAVSGWMTGDYRCPRGTVFCRRWNHSSRDGALAGGGDRSVGGMGRGVRGTEI
jgi:hypothetical protein